MGMLRSILQKAIDENKSLDCALFPLKIVSISNEIQRLYSGIQDARKSIDLDELHQVFSEAIKRNIWGNINDQQWKKACWILWHKDKSDADPIVSNPLFVDKYIKFLELNASSRILKNLIFVYLMEFDRNSPGQRTIASFIRINLDKDKFKNSLHLWKSRDIMYGIFDSDKDFSSNAESYMSGKQGAVDFLESLGLEGQLEGSNYAQKLFEEVISKVEASISILPASSNIFDKLKDLTVVDEKDLRYPKHKYALIESLLRPWKNKSPSVELKKQLLNFFLKYFYDLRTAKGRSNWVGVSEDSKKIVRKWLAGETLEQFFEIIDYTAQDEHWRYRREFWKAYFDAGHIDDACMAVGKDSRSAAKSQLVRGNELITSDIRGIGVKPDHSVLIFKVGDLTICEWSHDGKCRVWFENNNKAPELYKECYEAEELRSESETIVKGYKSGGISHHGSSKYLWQGQLSEFIEYHTGIKIPSYKYMSKSQ